MVKVNLVIETHVRLFIQWFGVWEVFPINVTLILIDADVLLVLCFPQCKRYYIYKELFENKVYFLMNTQAICLKNNFNFMDVTYASNFSINPGII